MEVQDHLRSRRTTAKMVNVPGVDSKLTKKVKNAKPGTGPVEGVARRITLQVCAKPQKADSNLVIQKPRRSCMQ